MKNIFGKILTVAVAAFAVVSCDLNLYPEASVVYTKGDVILASQEDIDASHNTVYVYFRAGVGGFYNTLEELMFDGFNATLDYGNNYGAIHRTDDTFTASDQDIESYWSRFYLSMKNYNIIIEATDNVSDELKENARFLKAEALLARAYSYQQLARHFGKDYDPATAETDLCVPLVTVYDQLAAPKRATVKEVYDQIKADLDTVSVIFAEQGEDWSEVNAMYFTPDVLRAMYARYYLDVHEYAAAADSALAVINSGKYTLSADAAALKAVYEADNGTEAILQLFASQDEAPNSYTAYANYGKDNRSATGYAYSSYFIPSKALMDLYDNNDYRKINWFKQTTDDPLIIQGNPINNVYLFSKFFGNPNLNADGLQHGRTAPKPFMISEMYLIAAEAYAQGIDATKAKQYLNQLQNKRKATLTSASLENIQKEWCKETVGDGMRMSNMKRWGIGFDGRAVQTNAAGIVMTTPATSYEGKVMAADASALCWPIPSYEIQITPSLVQNPGYGSNN